MRALLAVLVLLLVSGLCDATRGAGRTSGSRLLRQPRRAISRGSSNCRTNYRLSADADYRWALIGRDACEMAVEGDHAAHIRSLVPRSQ
jgi:hypothetical protein